MCVFVCSCNGIRDGPATGDWLPYLPFCPVSRLICRFSLYYILPIRRGVNLALCSYEPIVFYSRVARAFLN
jgi:hypothetical protein